jgi:hypothetical protein
VYSQNGEDGILLYLFSRIGVTDRRFVEFGIGDGQECNTTNLAVTFGWRGLLMEADEALVRSARTFYATRPTLRTSGVCVEHARLEPDSVDEVLQQFGVSGDLDLLSLDIDGNDYWSGTRSRDLAARRAIDNASFGPSRSVTVPYRRPSTVQRACERLHHASLLALTRLAHRKGPRRLRLPHQRLFVREDAANSRIEPVGWKPLSSRFERGHLTVDQQFGDRTSPLGNQ